MAEESELMSEGRSVLSRDRVFPPSPMPIKLKSFLSELIWGMSLKSVPKSMVCLPLIQVKPSRNSGTGTFRAWGADPRKGLEILGLERNIFGKVGAWRAGEC